MLVNYMYSNIYYSICKLVLIYPLALIFNKCHKIDIIFSTVHADLDLSLVKPGATGVWLARGAG